MIHKHQLSFVTFNKKPLSPAKLKWNPSPHTAQHKCLLLHQDVTLWGFLISKNEQPLGKDLQGGSGCKIIVYIYPQRESKAILQGIQKNLQKHKNFPPQNPMISL